MHLGTASTDEEYRTEYRNGYEKKTIKWKDENYFVFYTYMLLSSTISMPVITCTKW